MSPRLFAVAASAVAIALSAVSPARADTPRKSVDVTITGLTCTTMINGDASTRQPVPGTSSVRVRFTAPTVVANSEDISIRDLRVELTTNAGAALAARGGFTSFRATTQAFVDWSQLPDEAQYAHTDYDGPAQAIGGDIATNTFSTPKVGTTAGGYNGWIATSPVTGTDPAVARFSHFEVYGAVYPGAGGAENGLGWISCVVPEGVASELTSIPVRSDLPVITSVSPSETYVLQPTILTVRGRNFRNVRSIDLGPGGRTSAFIVNSSTQIQVFVVPFAWGPHPVRVVTPAYTSLPGYLFAKAWY